MRQCYWCTAAPNEMVIMIMNDYEQWYYCNNNHADQHLQFLAEQLGPFWHGARVSADLPVCI